MTREYNTCKYTYEVTFIRPDGQQSYDHVRANSKPQAKKRVLSWPDVIRIIGEPSRIK
jgi:hypothetical protein